MSVLMSAAANVITFSFFIASSSTRYNALFSGFVLYYAASAAERCTASREVVSVRNRVEHVCKTGAEKRSRTGTIGQERDGDILNQ